MIAVFAIPECWLCRRGGRGFFGGRATSSVSTVLGSLSLYSPFPSSGIIAGCGKRPDSAKEGWPGATQSGVSKQESPKEGRYGSEGGVKPLVGGRKEMLRLCVGKNQSKKVRR